MVSIYDTKILSIATKGNVESPVEMDPLVENWERMDVTPVNAGSTE